MSESVSVRCPECLRTHPYAAPVFPCACGSPVAPPLLPGGAPEPIRHRTWREEWVTVRCAACGREDDWPQPELGCPCGTLLRVPVTPVPATPAPDASAGTGGTAYGTDAPYGTPEAHEADAPYGNAVTYGADRTYGADEPYGTDEAYDVPPVPYEPLDPHALDDGWGAWDARLDGAGEPETLGDDAAYPSPHPSPYSPAPDRTGTPPFSERYPAHIPPPPRTGPAARRGPFRPVTIRTARDTVAAAAAYLAWLGFEEVRQPEDRHAAGADLRGPGLVAQVDPSTAPAGLRAVECLWLHGMNASAVAVFFSLAGYTPEARARAAEIRLPLFVLDLTGTPQPVNDAADELTSGGAV
ncbi:hypothetical protein [Streptomyces termitum]|uniref:hypothetical protein n=1 Tax=Streptomyces termitum TaxID=67368 RepID=UPI0033B5F2DC